MDGADPPDVLAPDLYGDRRGDLVAAVEAVMSRRAFLVGGLCKAAERPTAKAHLAGPVTAHLVAVDGTRSAPIEFAGRFAVPPLKFRAPGPGSWSHVELADGGRTRTWPLLPSFATWTGDTVRISGVTW